MEINKLDIILLTLSIELIKFINIKIEIEWYHDIIWRSELSIFRKNGKLGIVLQNNFA